MTAVHPEALSSSAPHQRLTLVDADIHPNFQKEWNMELGPPEAIRRRILVENAVELFGDRLA